MCSSDLVRNPVEERPFVLLEGIAEGGDLRLAAQLGGQSLRQLVPEGLLRLHVKEYLPLFPHQILKDLDPIALEGLSLFLHDVDEVVYGIRLVLKNLTNLANQIHHCVRIRTDHQIAANHQTFFRQQGMLHAHFPHFKIV